MKIIYKALLSMLTVFILAFSVIGLATVDKLIVDQNNDDEGLRIDSEATTRGNSGLRVLVGQGAEAGRFQQSSTDNGLTIISRMSNDSSGIAANWFYRNLNYQDIDVPLVFIEDDGINGDFEALRIQQDGNSSHIRMITKSTAPTNCKEGQVYTDDSGAFCYCYTANTWENLGSNGACV